MNRISLLLVAAVLLANPLLRAADKTNVLFIICDDLNCDIGSYGHPQVKTPNIDKLAARGVRFANAHCQYPLCGPSRASFMTGLYPDQTLVHQNAIYIREHTPKVVTMSEHFRQNGYFATRIGKMYHYNVPKHIGTSGHDDPYSWDYTINPRGRDVEEEPLIFSLRPGTFGATLSWLAAEGADEEQTDGMIAEAAVKELRRYRKEDRPFFLAVGLFRPHTPYVAPKKYFDLYPLEDIVVPEVPEGYEKTIPADALKSIRRRKEEANLADDLARQAIQAYYASISFADAQVGKILAALEDTGLDENTIVTFTSDHGYHMGEHGHWQKTTLFENATHVPMIIAAPQQKMRGESTMMPAEMVDFYPTLSELCDLNQPKHLSGVSLVPVLNDISVKLRESALSQYNNGYSIKTDRYRFTSWGEVGVAGEELYDHETDPEEMVNLIHNPEMGGIRTDLREEISKRILDAGLPPVGVKQVRDKPARSPK
ncbi:sulfatase [Verrucomicrobiales bacterium BCK34]|nr:sulfatase [Verrucomicrobiales bacterium BCK34]